MNGEELTTVFTKTKSVVEEAGEMLTDYFNKDSLSSRSKGGVDFATEADDAIDRFLREKLSSLFPETNFLTEETAPPDYAPLKDKENLWIIDPIDGTLNFSRKSPHCAISVAFAQKGKVILGIVFLPIEGKLYWTHDDDANAYENDKPLHVSSVDNLEESFLLFDWPWDLRERERAHALEKKILQKVRGTKKLGSAAADVCLVASGFMDAYFTTGIKPWDIAAATAILQKAGGVITKLDGTEWNVFDKELLASNAHLHKKLVTAFVK